MIRTLPISVLLLVCYTVTGTAWGQSVCLPAPRLLTTMPMGGQAGTQVEITISGEQLEDVGELVFSDPRITAAAKLDANQKTVPNQYVVAIPADCPAGIYEARVMTRLGLRRRGSFRSARCPKSRGRRRTPRWRRRCRSPSIRCANA